MQPTPVHRNGGSVITLRVEQVFTYSWDAATRIRIPYSAWFTPYMTWICTYSRSLYSPPRVFNMQDYNDGIMLAIFYSWITNEAFLDKCGQNLHRNGGSVLKVPCAPK